MIQIKEIPVGYPAKQANTIAIRLLPFQTTDTSCSTYYELIANTLITDEEGRTTGSFEVLASGNIPITEEQFLNWGSDNTYIENIILTNLSLERL